MAHAGDALSRVFTPRSMFLCVLSSSVQQGKDERPKVDMTGYVPRGDVLVLHTTKDHIAQPGYEHLLLGKKTAAAPRPRRGRPVKPPKKGDGKRCFNSAADFVVALNDHPRIAAGHQYLPKLFPTTGTIQVTGVVMPDFSDGFAVFAELVRFLNDGRPNGREPFVERLASRKVVMQNHRFAFLPTAPPNQIYEFAALAAILKADALVYNRIVDLTAVVEKIKNTGETPGLLAAFRGQKLVLCETQRERSLPLFPFDITRVIHTGGEIAIVSGNKFVVPRTTSRVKVFVGGKVNILGVSNVAVADRIYAWFAHVFRLRPDLVTQTPVPEVAARRRRRPRGAAAPPAVAAAAAVAVDAAGAVVAAPIVVDAAGAVAPRAPAMPAETPRLPSPEQDTITGAINRFDKQMESDTSDNSETENDGGDAVDQVLSMLVM